MCASSVFTLLLQNVSFFRANVASSIDNLDQRQTQDVERLCTSASVMLVIVVLNPFKIGKDGLQPPSVES